MKTDDDLDALLDKPKSLADEISRLRWELTQHRPTTAHLVLQGKIEAERRKATAESNRWRGERFSNVEARILKYLASMAPVGVTYLQIGDAADCGHSTIAVAVERFEALKMIVRVGKRGSISLAEQARTFVDSMPDPPAE